jgi:thiol-disulfide isomerase/thioredoxin
MPHDRTHIMERLSRGAQPPSRLSLVLFYALSLSLAGVPAAPHVEAAGTSAPDFDLVTFSGEAYSKATLRGHPTLLVFWAPWCNVCRRELPLLSEYSQKEKPSKLKILSIGFADTRGNVDAFVKLHAGTFVFPTAYDDDRWVAQAFKINATPTSIVLDEQGMIVLIHRGGGLIQNGRFRDFVSAFKK